MPMFIRCRWWTLCGRVDRLLLQPRLAWRILRGRPTVYRVQFLGGVRVDTNNPNGGTHIVECHFKGTYSDAERDAAVGMNLSGVADTVS